VDVQEQLAQTVRLRDGRNLAYAELTVCPGLGHLLDDQRWREIGTTLTRAA
jgi:hypothetical protein